MSAATTAALRSAALPKGPSLPLVGALPHLMWRGALGLFERCWRRHGDAFELRLGRTHAKVFVHPAAVEQVFVSERDNYIKGRTFDHLRLLLGAGMLTLDGPPWRKRRRLALPAFHKEAVRSMVQTMVDVTADDLAELRRRVPTGAVAEAHAEMLALTLDIGGAAILGQRLGAASGPTARAFAEAFAVVCARGARPVVLPSWMAVRGRRRLGAALESIDSIVGGIVVRARLAAAEERPTLLSMLIAARDADSAEALSHAELRDELITLLFASHETTALMMTWGLSLLGRHPEVVERMRAEVSVVLSGRPPTVDDLPRLVYLRQVIDEILRVYPPTWMLPRDVVADATIAGYAVRAGDTVMTLPYLTHRHPQFWDDPERFDPDRFRPERMKERNSRVAYTPFSIGPRACIGAQFTIFQAQVVLAMLLQRADFELVATRPARPQGLITLHPDGPMPIRLRWHPSAP